MQILPTNAYDSTFGFFDSGSGQSGDFYSAMNDALSSVQDGDAVSAEAALEETPHVDSPYVKHTTDGITYTMSEVLFSKAELAELRLELLKEGAPEESLKQFDILADQPNGATLAQVLASLMGTANEIRLTDDDKHAITAFLGQLDPTGDLAADVLAKMAQGNGEGALALIQKSLQDLGGTLDIDLNTAISLGRGLGLNQDSLRQLAENFGGSSHLTLSAAQFDTFMNPAKNQFLQDAANSAKLEGALDKTLRPIISKARARMEKEKLAAEHESRRVQQSKILIDKTVQENSRAMMDETVAGKEAEHALRNSKTSNPAGNSLKENLENIANNTGSAANAKSALNVAGNGEPIQTGQFAQNDSGKQSDNGKSKSDGWNDLFGKIEAKPASAQPTTASSLIYSMVQNEMEAEPLFAQIANQGDVMLPRQLAAQVEQGLLTAMRDGATRLDLQLHPAELGQMAITLIARNGEVTALIKSEKTETAEMMQRQVDTIRVNLEQQGVRIDKIEVQMENRQDFAQNNFDDLGNHNARQEEDARRQELQRMRNLASLRGNDGENSHLAQSMQDMGQTARYAGQALHVVA